MIKLAQILGIVAVALLIVFADALTEWPLLAAVLFAVLIAAGVALALVDKEA